MSQKYKSELYMIYHMITAQNLVILGFWDIPKTKNIQLASHFGP